MSRLVPGEVQCHCAEAQFRVGAPVDQMLFNRLASLNPALASCWPATVAALLM